MKMKMSALVLVAALSGVPVHAGDLAKKALAGSFLVAALWGSSDSSSSVQAREEVPGERSSSVAARVPKEKSTERKHLPAVAAAPSPRSQLRAVKIKDIRDIDALRSVAKDLQDQACAVEREQNAAALRSLEEQARRAVNIERETLRAQAAAHELEAARVRAQEESAQRAHEAVVAAHQRDAAQLALEKSRQDAALFTTFMKEVPAMFATLRAQAPSAASASAAGRGHGVTADALASTTLAPAPARSATPTPAARTVDVSVQGDGHTVAERVAVLDGHSS